MSSDNILVFGLTSGFLFGLGLIFSLGPQNLMLIRAGIARNHALTVASTGYLSEVAMVAMGIGGLGALLAGLPSLMVMLQIGGAAFLAWCGVGALRGAFRRPDKQISDLLNYPRHRAVGTMLIVTWLNPLVWIEVMFLVGVLSANHDRLAFAVGFLTASAIRFYGWSFAGMRLSHWLEGAGCRRALYGISGFALFLIAALVVLQLLGW